VKALAPDALDYAKMAFADPVIFAKQFLKFDLHDYQKKILYDCCDRKRIVAICPRQAGKSTVIAIFCIYWAFVVKDQKILIVSSTLRQAVKLFEIIKNLVARSNLIKSSVTDMRVQSLVVNNGSRIEALPTGVDGHTIRGSTADIVILEESAYIKDSIVHEVVTPMLSATDGTIIQIGTPIGRNHFYEAAQEASKYTVHQFDYKDCLSVGQYNDDFIEEQKINLSVPQFAREYMAQFTEDENTALPFELVNACVDASYTLPRMVESVHVPAKCYMGLDIGRFGSSTVMTIVSQDPISHKLRLIYYKELSSTSYEVQYGWILKLYRHFGPKMIVVDMTGMGIPVYERIQVDRRIATMVKGVNFNTKSKMSMFSTFYKIVDGQLITLPNDKRLINQCIEQQKIVNSQGNDIFSCPENAHDDILWSLILACYPLKAAGMMSYCRVNA